VSGQREGRGDRGPVLIGQVGVADHVRRDALREGRTAFTGLPARGGGLDPVEQGLVVRLASLLVQAQVQQ
jgi:hypothetical protein